TRPDLLPLAWWALDVTLTLGDSGERLDVDDDAEDDYLVGPAGWLRPSADGHVEVRIAGTQLHVTPATMADPPPEILDAVRATFERGATFEELRDPFDRPPVDLTQMGVEDLCWEL